MSAFSSNEHIKDREIKQKYSKKCSTFKIKKKRFPKAANSKM
jgi:hypothetical protein